MAKTKATQQIVSPEVINMIRDIDRSLFDKREELHLDLFHMSYYTGGMSLTNLASLEWFDIDDGDILECTRFLYPLCDGIEFDHRHMGILNKYALTDTDDDGFIFPVDDTIKTSVKGWKNRINAIASEINKTLQKAVSILGLDVKVTFRSARYSYLLLCAQEGISFPEALKFAGGYAIRAYDYYENRIQPYFTVLKQVSNALHYSSAETNRKLVN